ncbi:thioesterase family protein [Phenylobacterium soli]|uniref:Thioesterase family protein n=1 Tax=Phenylobacterium soli TaxID=2170551 RepID=A0A328AIV6_9CAUL|nr:acyl-CoA thioesterase domain-containing protein [Phenylobacterium soli]RAK54549.1 thioesterase family protein [Phenylobacterium soli]
MANTPFFTVKGDHYLPTEAGKGPWNANSLHGRVIIGLLGHEIERLHGAPEFLPARLTVDMYRLPDMSPVEIVTRVVREGYRIKVIDAEFISGGVSAGRATCQLLRKTERPEGEVWKPPSWDVPRPEDIPPPEPRTTPMGGMWSSRLITGGFMTGERRRMWMAEVRELVEGRPLTPFQRVAVAADFASPAANAGDKGLKYINSDVTIYLHREPVSEWVGFEVTDHGDSHGVAFGETRLYDVDGPIGMASCCALAQKRST